MPLSNDVRDAIAEWHTTREVDSSSVLDFIREKGLIFNAKKEKNLLLEAVSLLNQISIFVSENSGLSEQQVYDKYPEASNFPGAVRYYLRYYQPEPENELKVPEPENELDKDLPQYLVSKLSNQMVDILTLPENLSFDQTLFDAFNILVNARDLFFSAAPTEAALELTRALKLLAKVPIKTEIKKEYKEYFDEEDLEHTAAQLRDAFPSQQQEINLLVENKQIEQSYDLLRKWTVNFFATQISDLYQGVEAPSKNAKRVALEAKDIISRALRLGEADKDLFLKLLTIRKKTKGSSRGVLKFFQDEFKKEKRADSSLKNSPLIEQVMIRAFLLKYLANPLISVEDPYLESVETSLFFRQLPASFKAKFIALAPLERIRFIEQVESQLSFADFSQALDELVRIGPEGQYLNDLSTRLKAVVEVLHLDEKGQETSARSADLQGLITQFLYDTLKKQKEIGCDPQNIERLFSTHILADLQAHLRRYGVGFEYLLKGVIRHLKRLTDCEFSKEQIEVFSQLLRKAIDYPLESQSDALAELEPIRMKLLNQVQYGEKSLVDYYAERTSDPISGWVASLIAEDEPVNATIEDPRVDELLGEMGVADVTQFARPGVKEELAKLKAFYLNEANRSYVKSILDSLEKQSIDVSKKKNTPAVMAYLEANLRTSNERERNAREFLLLFLKYYGKLSLLAEFKEDYSWKSILFSRISDLPEAVRSEAYNFARRFLASKNLIRESSGFRAETNSVIVNQIRYLLSRSKPDYELIRELAEKIRTFDEVFAREDRYVSDLKTSLLQRIKKKELEKADKLREFDEIALKIAQVKTGRIRDPFRSTLALRKKRALMAPRKPEKQIDQTVQRALEWHLAYLENTRAFTRRSRSRFFVADVRYRKKTELPLEDRKYFGEEIPRNQVEFRASEALHFYVPTSTFVKKYLLPCRVEEITSEGGEKQRFVYGIYDSGVARVVTARDLRILCSTNDAEQLEKIRVERFALQILQQLQLNQPEAIWKNISADRTASNSEVLEKLATLHLVLSPESPIVSFARAIKRLAKISSSLFLEKFGIDLLVPEVYTLPQSDREAFFQLTKKYISSKATEYANLLVSKSKKTRPDPVMDELSSFVTKAGTKAATKVGANFCSDSSTNPLTHPFWIIRDGEVVCSNPERMANVHENEVVHAIVEEVCAYSYRDFLNSPERVEDFADSLLSSYKTVGLSREELINMILSQARDHFIHKATLLAMEWLSQNEQVLSAWEDGDKEAIVQGQISYVHYTKEITYKIDNLVERVREVTGVSQVELSLVVSVVSSVVRELSHVPRKAPERRATCDVCKCKVTKKHTTFIHEDREVVEKVCCSLKCMESLTLAYEEPAEQVQLDSLQKIMSELLSQKKYPPELISELQRITGFASPDAETMYIFALLERLISPSDQELSRIELSMRRLATFYFPDKVQANARDLFDEILKEYSSDVDKKKIISKLQSSIKTGVETKASVIKPFQACDVSKADISRYVAEYLNPLMENIYSVDSAYQRLKFYPNLEHFLATFYSKFPQCDQGFAEVASEIAHLRKVDSEVFSYLKGATNWSNYIPEFYKEKIRSRLSTKFPDKSASEIREMVESEYEKEKPFERDFERIRQFLKLDSIESVIRLFESAVVTFDKSRVTRVLEEAGFSAEETTGIQERYSSKRHLESSLFLELVEQVIRRKLPIFKKQSPQVESNEVMSNEVMSNEVMSNEVMSNEFIPADPTQSKLHFVRNMRYIAYNYQKQEALNFKNLSEAVSGTGFRNVDIVDSAKQNRIRNGIVDFKVYGPGPYYWTYQKQTQEDDLTSPKKPKRRAIFVKTDLPEFEHIKTLPYQEQVFLYDSLKNKKYKTNQESEILNLLEEHLKKNGLTFVKKDSPEVFELKKSINKYMLSTFGATLFTQNVEVHFDNKSIDVVYSKEECEEWEKFPSIDPKTRKAIQPFSSIWMTLEEECRKDREIEDEIQEAIADVFGEDQPDEQQEQSDAATVREQLQAGDYEEEDFGIF